MPLIQNPTFVSYIQRLYEMLRSFQDDVNATTAHCSSETKPDWHT